MKLKKLIGMLAVPILVAPRHSHQGLFRPRAWHGSIRKICLSWAMTVRLGGECGLAGKPRRRTLSSWGRLILAKATQR